jgi:uncharacterized protein (TIGR03000 family)
MKRSTAFRMITAALAGAGLAGEVSAGQPHGYLFPNNSFGIGVYAPSYYGYPLDEMSAGYYGGGRYREYYNFGRGYGIANYPDSYPGRGLPPDYRGPRHPGIFPHSQGIAQPVASPLVQGGTVAHITVQVPADAEVWIEDQKTQQSGGSRWFVSPPLARGQVFEYRIRARWKEDGKAVEQTQRLSVQAGEQLTVSFPTGGKKEVVTTPRPFPLADE